MSFVLEKLLYLIIFCILFILDLSSLELSKVLVLFAIVLNVRLLIMYRNVIPVFIFFIFSITYIQPFIYHFFLDVSVSFHKSFNDSYHLGFAISVYTLFFLSIFTFSNQVSDYTYLRKRITYNSSNIRYYVILAIILMLIHFTLRGESLLSGRYGSIEKQQSPLFEYVMIFIAVISSYINDSKLFKRLLFLVIFFMICKDFLYGGRITSLQVLLLVFILFFEDVISKKKIYLLMLFGFLLLTAVEAVRSNPFLFLSGNFTLSDLFIKSSNHQLATNQGDIAQASARLIGLVESGVMTLKERVQSFIYSFISIFTPGFSFSNLTNLAAFKTDTYSAGGGAFFPIYFYVWLSYPGVIFSGFIVSKFIKVFINSTNNYLILFSCLVMCTFPRWLAYNPIVMFKLCMYVIPVYYFFKKTVLNVRRC